MLWSIDGSQKGASSDQCEVTVSRAQVYNSWRWRTFLKLSIDRGLRSIFKRWNSVGFLLTATPKDPNAPGMYSSVRRTLRASSRVWLAAVRHFFAVPLNDPKSFGGHKSYQTPARLDHSHIFRHVLNEWMSSFKIFTSVKGIKFIRYNIWLPVVLSWSHQLVWPVRLPEHLKKHITEKLEKVWWDPRQRAQMRAIPSHKTEIC